jgi:hypothetical protein
MPPTRDAATPRAAPASTATAGPAPAARTPEPPLARLQRAAGNRAVGALVRRPGAGDDALEREARRAGDGILRPGVPSASSVRAGTGGGGGAVRASAGGAPLPAGERAFFEGRFGRDFGGVRVHTDARSAASARAVNAVAYARGRDIVFRAGAYAPGTQAGRRLLAHELAHVVQHEQGRTDALLHRYESAEHQDLGDRHLGGLLAFLETEAGRAWAARIGENRDTLVAQIRADPMQNGGTIGVTPPAPGPTGAADRVTLTPGQIISLMGDFYGSVEQMVNAPPAEIRQILAVIDRQRAGTISNDAANPAYERITGGRYLRLAARNAPHFAPLNRTEWRRLHQEAVAEARAAGTAPGPASDAAFERALLRDAAAGHFLTDAYAAGHLLDQGQILAAIALHLHNNPPHAANPQMQMHVAVVNAAGQLPHLVLKNIHDRMNVDGFEVANARGMRWRTRGDDHLHEATETQRVAALAVFLSRQQLYAARRGEETDPAEVEGLMPNDDSIARATQQAMNLIPEGVREVEALMYRSRSLAPTRFGLLGGTIIQSNLSAIGDPARERHMADLIERAEQMRFGPVIAPSFVLGRF